MDMVMRKATGYVWYAILGLAIVTVIVLAGSSAQGESVMYGAIPVTISGDVPGLGFEATSTVIAKIARREGVDSWGEYWRYTAQGAGYLFREYSPKKNVKVGTHGNVLASIAFLHGLSAEELNAHELDYLDPDYEVVVAVRAVKPLTEDSPALFYPTVAVGQDRSSGSLN